VSVAPRIIGAVDPSGRLHSHNDGARAQPLLTELAQAIIASWDDDTMYATNEPSRKPGDRSRGQCGTTALVLARWMGGTIMVADVTRDGIRVGPHYWNRLPDGQEIDLTRGQFLANESLGPAREVAPKAEELWSTHPGFAPYLVLRERVATRLASKGVAKGQVMGKLHN
jgi:hypothetical protein